MAPGSAKATLRRCGIVVDEQLRAVNPAERARPDFLVIGAQKAGTTSLYAYLSQHPNVLRARHKELHYFDMDYHRGERWYLSMFPTERRMAAARRTTSGPVVTGEASPYYLFHPLAPERAARLVPAAKILVLLRNPVERAWSHYGHEVAAGREQLSFTDALAAEPERLLGGTDAIRSGRDTPAATWHRTASYLARGRYAEQLRSWLTRYPRESMLVVESEKMFSSPAEQLGRISEFLGVPAGPASTYGVHNSRPSADLDPQLRSRLHAAFEESNADLTQLLGARFSWC